MIQNQIFRDDLINQQLIINLNDSKDLNYSRLLLPKNNGTISVIGEYRPCDDMKAYCTLNHNLEVVIHDDLSKFYYGVSPIIDGNLIVEAISKLRFYNEEGLNDFISEYCDAFMMHIHQQDMLLACAKLFVISIAHNFGIRIRINDPSLYKELLKLENKSLIIRGRSDDEIMICGCPTQELLDVLNGSYFKLQEDYWQQVASVHANGISIQMIYQNADHIILLKGHTFYSGVLLRIKKIEELTNYGNDHVVPMRLVFERSTYGTVYTLDNNFLSHPLLKDCNRKLSKMFKEDDAYKRELLANTMSDQLSRKQLCEAINQYLEKSHNVNQLGVTGNLVTNDHILLVGVRESDSIDSGLLYPSVNGNAEVIDENVSFYKLSSYEDYPAINIHDHRIDFDGELGREAYAELGIVLKDNWDCYGITLSGNIPNENMGDDYLIKSRRMHFNIICEQTCDYSFLEILENQKHANESFENKTINGLDISYYKNKSSFYLIKIKKALFKIMDMENYIMAFAVIAAFLSNYFISKGMDMESGSLDIISTFFAMLTIVALMISLIGHIKDYMMKRSHISKIKIIGQDQPYKKLNHYLYMHKSHPATRVALMCHITKKVFQKDEK